MRTRSRAVFGLALGTAAMVACRGSTGPAERPRVVVAAEAVGTDDDWSETVTAAGRLNSVVISGGPRLTCGVTAAAGRAEIRGEQLRVHLMFRPMQSCPFAPTRTRYEAIVTMVPPGLYDVEVTQSYWPHQPEDILLQQRLRVAGADTLPSR